MSDDELKRALRQIYKDSERRQKEREDDETLLLFCLAYYGLFLPLMVGLIWFIPVTAWAILVLIVYGMLFGIINMYELSKVRGRSDDRDT